MEFRILGSVEAFSDGSAVSLGATKQRALLALLLLNANEIVPTDRLVDEIWGEGAAPASAAHSIQVYVSELRKVLEPARAPGERDRLLQTRSPGYLIRVEDEQLDLHRFERLLARGRDELARGDPRAAGETLRQALGLWRGAPLADFVYEPFAQNAIARLEELHLGALEERIAADLALGRHAEVVPELESLVARNPLRERLRALLMLALYRSGRQAEALETYALARRALVDELGIDPGPELQRLERAILRQDAELDAEPVADPPRVRPARGTERPARSILCVARSDEALRALTALAGPLSVAAAPHELIAVRLVDRSETLSGAVADANALASELSGEGVRARAAAFTSSEPGSDVSKLASEQDVDLLLLAGAELPAAGPPAADVREILDRAPCDVALLGARRGDGGRSVAVPFGGGEHDWAALELGAWIASASGELLRLVSTTGDEASGKRDASRLLASASLAVQQLVGVQCEPVLVRPDERELVDAVEGARLVVLGLPDRWRHDGLGATRTAVVRRAGPATLLVRRGVRPGGLAPNASLTRYTWSAVAAPDRAPAGSS